MPTSYVIWLLESRIVAAPLSIPNIDALRATKRHVGNRRPGQSAMHRDSADPASGTRSRNPPNGDHVEAAPSRPASSPPPHRPAGRGATNAPRSRKLSQTIHADHTALPMAIAYGSAVKTTTDTTTRRSARYETAWRQPITVAKLASRARLAPAPARATRAMTR